MALFHGIYKCRLCGELFESITTASENTAIESFRVQPMMANGIRRAAELVRMYVTFTIVKMEAWG